MDLYLGEHFNALPRSKPMKRYRPPLKSSSRSLGELVSWSGRGDIADSKQDLLRRANAGGDIYVYFSGDITLLRRPCVSIVGTRNVTDEGYRRATRLAKELVAAGTTVVSGLAKGVDTAAHNGAIQNGGKTVAVIGTPLDKAYPSENANLQEIIYSEHLLMTPFQLGQPVYKSNFPSRNKIMAAISDATVIVEASDTSGTLHQAAECHRIGRWLFIMKSVLETNGVTWPERFLGHPRTAVLSSSEQILEIINK